MAAKIVIVCDKARRSAKQLPCYQSFKKSWKEVVNFLSVFSVLDNHRSFGVSDLWLFEPWARPHQAEGPLSRGAPFGGGDQLLEIRPQGQALTN